MAAKVPDSIVVVKKGTVREFIATFSSTDLDNGDTWASGIVGIVDAAFHPSTTTGVVGVAFSGSDLTFACSAANQLGRLVVTARS